MSKRREPSADGDLPRDERLLEALRHAPDHDIEPPAALSARILASARAATLQTSPAARPAKPGWARALDALGPRKPWAAAFGTLVVAVLVGLLWSTQHDGEAPAPGTHAADAAGRDSSPAPAAATPPEARNAVPAAAAPAPIAQPAPAPAPVVPKPAAPTPAAPTPAAPAVAPAAIPARAAPETAARERAAAPSEAAAAAKTEAAPAARGAAVAAAPAPAAPAQASSEKLSAAAGAERRSEAADTAARPAALTRSGDPIARLDAALAAQPEAVSWRHALRTHFHESPQRRWWSQLRDDTRGRWRAVQDTRRESVEPWVTVSVEGRRVATFWFEGEALWLRDDVGLWRVPATPAQQRAWQATLVTW